MVTTPQLAEAIAELETYSDEEHRAVLDLVREILDLDEAEPPLTKLPLYP